MDKKVKPLNFLSVVIPIHNCEKYLNSLSKETVQLVNLGAQVIFVDDGSSDDTYNELRRMLNLELASADVLLLRQVHQGPGLARNHGLRSASREFVAFWDADDKRVVSGILQITSLLDEADIVISGFEISDFETGKMCHPPQLLGNWEDDLSLNGGLWRLFIRRSFIGDLEFTSSYMGEDLVFLSGLIARDPRVTTHRETCYIYSSGSASQLTSGKVRLREASKSIQALVMSPDEPTIFENKVAHRYIVKLFITVMRSCHLRSIIRTIQILLTGRVSLVIVRAFQLIKASLFLAKYQRHPRRNQRTHSIIDL